MCVLVNSATVEVQTILEAPLIHSPKISVYQIKLNFNHNKYTGLESISRMGYGDWGCRRRF